MHLNTSCKKILRAIRDKKYSDIPECDTEDLLLLEQIGLVNIKWCEFGYAIVANLSNKGIAYLRVNPKLKDPSIFEDKKFWINTVISITALLVALFDDYLKKII